MTDYPATLHKVESQLLITACAQPGATCSCPSLSSFPLGSCFHRCLRGCFHLCFPDPGTVTVTHQFKAQTRPRCCVLRGWSLFGISDLCRVSRLQQNQLTGSSSGLTACTRCTGMLVMHRLADHDSP